MIEVIIAAIIFGYIGGKIAQNPRYRCAISQGRWISQKEWDEA